MLWIAWITILRNFRDKQELLLMIILPIALIFILGNALQGDFEGEMPTNIEMAYLNQDPGHLSMAVDEYINGMEGEEILQVRHVDSEKDGVRLVEAGEIPAFLFVPDYYSEKVLKGEHAALQITTDPRNEFNASIIEHIMESFTQIANAFAAWFRLSDGEFMDLEIDEDVLKELFEQGEWDVSGIEENTESTDKHELFIEDAVEEQEGQNGLAADEYDQDEFAEIEAIFAEGITGDGEEAVFEERSLLGQEEMPGAMEYYAVTMMVMTIMYGAMYGAMGLKDDYLSSLGNRIASTPVRFWDYFVGKNLGNVVTIFLQGLVIILFTSLVYGVDWGEAPGIILLVNFSLAVLATGLGVMVMMIARNEGMVNSLLNVLIPVTTFIAGGYIVFPRPGELFNLFQHLSPNYLAQTAIFNTIYQGPVSYTVWYLGAIWLIVAAVFLASLLVERRKRI